MSPTLIPAAVLVAITVVGILVLRRFSNRTRLTFDVVCFLAISLYLLREQIAPVFPPLAGPIEGRAIWLRALAGAWWWLGARIIAVGLEFAVRRDRHSREVRLFSDLLAAAIYIAAAAVVLNSVLALPVTGVVATSGVVAIVLGLALQSTLADVFSGIAVGIEAPFGIGDRILIGDKIEGQVVQMNWRSIRVQTDGDDIAIIPNNLVAKAEIINRSFPSQQRAASVEITCRRSAAPERVIEALLQATLLCPDMLRSRRRTPCWRNWAPNATSTRSRSSSPARISSRPRRICCYAERGGSFTTGGFWTRSATEKPEPCLGC